MPTLTQRSRRSEELGINATPEAFASVPLTPAITAMFVVVLCATRLFGITHHSLWYDEGYTLNLVDTHSLSQFLQLFSNYTMSEHLQPLYYFLMYGWSRLAGDSDLAMRLPSALFSIASGLILFSLLRLLGVKRQGFGWVLLLLFAASSYSIYYAQEARPYAMVQMLSFAVITLWVDRRFSLGPRDEVRFHLSKIAFCLVAALCVLGSAFSAMLVFCLCVAELITLRSVRRWWTVWHPALATCGLGVAAYLVVLQRQHAFGATRNFIVLRQSLWMNMPYVFSGLLFGSTLPPGTQALRGPAKIHALVSAWPVILLCVFSVALALLAFYRLLRAPKALPKITGTIALATGMYVVALFAGFGWAGRLNVLPRHGSSLFAMLTVLILLLSLPRRKQVQSWKPVYAYALISVFACNVLSLWEYFGNTIFLKDDYRATASFLASRREEPVFLVEGQPKLLHHYGASAVNATEIPPAELSAFLKGNTVTGGPVRLVVNRYRGYLWDRQESVSSVIAPMYQCREEAGFSYMDVDLCLPRGSIASAERKLPAAQNGATHVP